MPTLDELAERFDLPGGELRRWLIEAMVIAAAADGEFQTSEFDAILELIVSREEFATLQPGELRQMLERASEAIIEDGFRARIHALAGALPRYTHRVVAFRAAVLVTLADGRLADGEIEVLRAMQSALGLTEQDVQNAFSEAEREGDLPFSGEVEPIDTYLDCLLMAAAADREIADEEMATLIAFILSREEFDGLDADLLHEEIRRRLNLYAGEGRQKRLAELAEELPNGSQRENAYGLAISMVVADGDIAGAERRFLEQLREALALDASRVQILTDAAKG